MVDKDFKDCSIVIPVHNEADKLEEFFLEFWDNLGIRRNWIANIHLMENGSSDNTLQICRKLEKSYPKIVFAHKLPIPSYGEAVKQGILASSGTAICILECDFMDISFFSASLEIIRQNKADFVLGSKQHSNSIDHRPFRRRMLTWLFNLWLKLHFHFPGSDTHGLKTIRADVAKSLCESSITGGEIFQTEIVLLAHRLGYRVEELPICLKEQRDTKVSIIRRFPKVMKVIKELKQSLARYPEENS